MKFLPALRGLMPWSHLCVKLPRMSNVRQIKEIKIFGAVLSRIVPRTTQHLRGYPRYRHVGDTTVESADFTWQNFQKASRRARKGPVTTTYCHVDAVFATS